MTRRCSLAVLCVLLTWLGTLPAFSQKPTAPASKAVVLRGWASWYGKKWKDHFTASGEQFHPEELTAASPTLPLGSLVEVTNLLNGRVVHLVINDRGPFQDGRILDVSHAAAEVLGFLQAGVTRVRVRLLSVTASPDVKRSSDDSQKSHTSH